MTQITDLRAVDIRFPTSDHLDGSDAMNPDPDYSAAYVTVETNNGLSGNGIGFTLGRGTELIVNTIDSLKPLLIGKSLDEIASDMGGFWRHVTGDSQLRWLGPDKGVVHLATGAVVNAVWDLYAKAEKKPLWRLLSDMTPDELVRCIDFRYISDALSPERARTILEEKFSSRSERINNLLKWVIPHIRRQQAGSVILMINYDNYAEMQLQQVGLTSKSKLAVISTTIFTGPESFEKKSATTDS